MSEIAPQALTDEEERRFRDFQYALEWGFFRKALKAYRQGLGDFVAFGAALPSPGDRPNCWFFSALSGGIRSAFGRRSPLTTKPLYELLDRIASDRAARVTVDAEHRSMATVAADMANFRLLDDENIIRLQRLGADFSHPEFLDQLHSWVDSYKQPVIEALRARAAQAAQPAIQIRRSTKRAPGL